MQRLLEKVCPLHPGETTQEPCASSGVPAGEPAQGRPLQFRNLTVIPLLCPLRESPGYLTLDEALGSGAAKVTEVSQQGSVPELRFCNDGERPVLLLDGEELVGAKQNRVLNATIMAPGCQSLVIPVSCVEQRRWSYKSDTFSSSSRTQHVSGRAQKIRSVTDSLTSNGTRRSDQRQVWNSVSTSSVRLGVSSSTNAMSDMYEQHSERIEEYVQGLPVQPGQSGAVFAINGKVMGLVLFDTQATYARLSPKLVRSYAVEAIQGTADPTLPSAETIEHWLQAAASSAARRFPALGLGTEVRLTGEKLAGSALIVDGRVIHLEVLQIVEPPEVTVAPSPARVTSVTDDASPACLLLGQALTALPAERGLVISKTTTDEFCIEASNWPPDQEIQARSLHLVAIQECLEAQTAMLTVFEGPPLRSVVCGPVDTADGRRVVLYLDSPIRMRAFKLSDLSTLGDVVVAAGESGSPMNAAAWPRAAGP